MRKTIINISPNYSYSFNKYIYDQIPPERVCLDVGCWSGNLGKQLIQKKHCTVDGIDVKPDVLKTALKNGYRKTYLINLNDDPTTFNLPRKKYQFIVFADVLEHLVNPDKILLCFKNLLTPDGKIIISLPNIAFVLYRILLLCGQWNYRQYGTIERTHLRFYTIRTGIELVKSVGLKVCKVKPYNQFGILRYIKPLDIILPSLFAYQFLIIAESK